MTFRQIFAYFTQYIWFTWQLITANVWWCLARDMPEHLRRKVNIFFCFLNRSTIGWFKKQIIMLLFQSCGVEPKITFVTEAGIRICNIDCPKCDMVLRISYSSNENTGKLSYIISNFKSHFFPKHGDDILTASSDHDSIISDISLPTPATPSILSQRSRKHSVQRSCLFWER